MQGVEGETAQGGVERASQQASEQGTEQASERRTERRVGFGVGRTSECKEGAGGGAGCVFAHNSEARPSS